MSSQEKYVISSPLTVSTKALCNSCCMERVGEAVSVAIVSSSAGDLARDWHATSPSGACLTTEVLLVLPGRQDCSMSCFASGFLHSPTLSQVKRTWLGYKLRCAWLGLLGLALGVSAVPVRRGYYLGKGPLVGSYSERPVPVKTGTGHFWIIRRCRPKTCQENKHKVLLCMVEQTTCLRTSCSDCGTSPT